MVAVSYTKPKGISLVGGNSQVTSVPIQGATKTTGMYGVSQLQPASSIKSATTIPIQGSSSNVQGSSVPLQVSTSPMAYTVPTATTTGTTGTTSTSDSSGGNTVSTGSSFPDYSGANAILRSNISSLNDIYNSDIARAIEAAQIAENERQSSLKASEQANLQSGINNDYSLLNARNATNKNVRTSADRILSVLGALGMGGSTRRAAMNAVADEGNESMNTANYIYGTNKRSILQSWNDFINKSENEKKQIADTKAYAESAAKVNQATNAKNLLSQIAANMIESGQDTSGILDEINAANRSIAEASNVRRTYTGETPVYNAPSIREILGMNPTQFGVTNAIKSGSKTVTPRIIRVNNSEKEVK